jgi:hypothetical protein
MYFCLHVMCPLFMSDFSETWIFSSDFRKIHKYKLSRKSIQWHPSCFMRTDRQTDITGLILSFRKFANAPQICQIHDVATWEMLLINLFLLSCVCCWSGLILLAAELRCCCRWVIYVHFCENQLNSAVVSRFFPLLSYCNVSAHG